MNTHHTLLSTLLAGIAMMSAATATAQQATRLTTDMIEHTDRVWLDGYPSTATLATTDSSNPHCQTAMICSSHPTLGWVMASDRPCTRQTAYRILVATSAERLAEGKADVWDSGAVESDGQSVTIPVGLRPAATYYWRVRLRDSYGRTGGYSAVRAFRTAGTLDADISHYPIEKTDEQPTAVSTIQSANAHAPLISDGHALQGAALMYDFGRDAFAQLSLTVDAPTCTDTLTIHLGEQCRDGRVNRRPEGSQRYSRYVLPLMRGTHTYRLRINPDSRNTSPHLNESGVSPILMPQYTGEVTPMRYCEIEAAAQPAQAGGGTRPVGVAAVTRHTAQYPFDDRAASFTSSDSVLNSVWQLCRHSMKALSFAGIYVDGDRERIPYEADAIINQLSHYAVDNAFSIARRSVRHLIYNPTWPTEWILQSVIMAWNDYMYTGDDRLLTATYDDLKAKTLCPLRHDNALITTRDGGITDSLLSSIHFRGKGIRDIVDWPQTGAKGVEKEADGEADGFVFTKYNTVVNAYHYEALTLMSRIAGVLGRADDERQYADMARATRQAMNTLLTDPSTGLYTDGIGTRHSSLHGNMFALCFGVPRAADRQRVADFVKSRGMGCSVYGAQFLLDALYDAGEDGAALALLCSTGRRSWWNMLRIGSTITTEAWDNIYKPNQDWNHAWGAAAANIIVRKLMGIEPLEPGFARIRIKPQTASLKEASVMVPTIRGDVGLDVSRGSMTVHIPANTSAEVWVKTDARRVSLDGHAVRGRRDGRFLVLTVGSGRHTILN